MKVEQLFESYTSLLLYAPVSPDNSKYGTSFRFWSLSHDISLYGTSFPFWYVCTTNKKSLYVQIHLLKIRRDIWMTPNMLQTIPSFYEKSSEKSLSISANTYEKDIVCKDYCIAHHDDKTCFLPA